MTHIHAGRSEKSGFRRDRVQEAKAPASDDGIEEFIFVLNT